MLGALVKTMESRGLDHWFSSRFKGVEDSITDCVSEFTVLLYEIRAEAVDGHEPPHFEKDFGPWPFKDQHYGDEGTQLLHDLVLGYAGHLRKQAEKSGVDPAPFPRYR